LLVPVDLVVLKRFCCHSSTKLPRAKFCSIQIFSIFKNLRLISQDLMTNPLIVPVKILRGHKIEDYLGVLDCAFHPTQPWIFSAGGDGLILLFTN
jgi:hypothetical protein